MKGINGKRFNLINPSERGKVSAISDIFNLVNGNEIADECIYKNNTRFCNSAINIIEYRFMVCPMLVKSCIPFTFYAKRNRMLEYK